MQISEINRHAGTSGTTGTTSNLGRDDFLKLLLAQVQNQNPLEPLKDGEFMAQLAQFSTVEGIDRLNTSFDEMFRLQQLTQGAGLVGKRVSYDQPGSSSPLLGMVESVSLQAGRLVLTVGGKQISLDQVRTIERPA